VGGGFWHAWGAAETTIREHGPAMADVEIEARQACAKLGIDKVWFLGEKILLRKCFEMSTCSAHPAL